MLDDGGYRRNSKDDEAEYAKNGSTIQTVGDEGFVDVEDANYDDNDSLDDMDDYGDGSIDIME